MTTFTNTWQCGKGTFKRTNTAINCPTVGGKDNFDKPRFGSKNPRDFSIALSKEDNVTI